MRAASDAYPVPVQQAALSSTVDSVAAVGNVAAGSADAGWPLKIGGKAGTSVPGTVDAGDRVDALFSLTGKQVILPYSLGPDLCYGTSGVMSTTGTATVLAPTMTVGQRLYVTEVLVQNSSSGTATWVNLQEQTSGSILHTVYAPASGGGAALHFPAPLRLPGTATALCAVCETANAAVRVSATGYVGV